MEIEREKVQFVVNQNQTLSDALQILKNLCEIFSKGRDDETARVLRFVFPTGVVYETGNYQTTETCSISKLKRIFETLLSQLEPAPISSNGTQSY